MSCILVHTACYYAIVRWVVIREPYVITAVLCTEYSVPTWHVGNITAYYCVRRTTYCVGRYGVLPMGLMFYS